MDILQFFGSVNKISLLAFIGTFIFLFYEVHLLRKEKQKKKAPSIPQFKENVNVPISSSKVIVETKNIEIKKHKNMPIIVFIAIFLLMVVATSAFLLNSKSTTSTQANFSNPTPIVQMVTSTGVKFFSKTFEAMTDKQVSGLRRGDGVIIAVETVEGTDIDFARIKVNKIAWTAQDITIDFDKKNKVFFINYTVATEESQLKVDAQLHSKKDGWLGE